MKQAGFIVQAAVTAALFLSGCAASGSGPGAAGPQFQPAKAKSYKIETKTATERAVGKCVGVMTFSALAGAVIGQAAGRDARSGAVVGAVIGSGACAAFLELAAEEDQRRLRLMQQEAVAKSASQTQSFQTSKGVKATVRTSVEDAPEVAQVAVVGQGKSSQRVTACRYAAQEVSVGAESVSAPRQLWCRLETGDWTPLQQ